MSPGAGISKKEILGFLRRDKFLNFPFHYFGEKVTGTLTKATI